MKINQHGEPQYTAEEVVTYFLAGIVIGGCLVFILTYILWK